MQDAVLYITTLAVSRIVFITEDNASGTAISSELHQAAKFNATEAPE